MKASVFYDTGDIRYEEMELPSFSDGEALVRVKVCGLCGTDVSKMRWKTVATPAVLGHEVAGDIAELGKGVRGFETGDRVIVTHHLPCFVCRYCGHGNYSQCDSFKKMNILPGGFSEYIRVLEPAVRKSMFRIPENLSYEEACFAETVGCCIRGINRCNISSGDRTVVVGAGPVGLLHLQLLRSFGASLVIMVDLLDYRLSIAKKFGADFILNPSRDDIAKAVKEMTQGGADIIIVCAGSVEAVKQSMEFVCPGGKVLIFAGCPEDSVVEINPSLIYHSEVMLFGSYSSTPLEQREAIRLIDNGTVRVKELITHRFRLHELSEALKVCIKAQDCMKVIIEV